MITPYDYQKGVIAKMLSHLGVFSKALMVMATGLGKTVTAAFVLRGLLEIKMGRTLFLCHQNNILEQAKDEYGDVFEGKLTSGLFHGDAKEFDRVDVLFASFQTMVDWKEAFKRDEFDYVFVDESHHGHAQTYREVIEYFTPKVLVGMTATPDREDQKDIREIFGSEVVNISLEEGIANGWLSPVEYHIMSDDLDQEVLKKLVEEVLESGERVSKKQINDLIFIKRRDESIAEKILIHSGKKIIFCESVMHAENFKRFIPGSEVCHSKQSRTKNKKVIENFRSGLLRHILVVDKFNEGIDIPDAEVIVFLRCTESRTIFFQQLGRGLRKDIKNGKEKVVVLDFVANCQRIQSVRSLIQGIQKFGTESEAKVPLHIIGRGFDFVFTDEVANIFDVLDKIQIKYVSDYPELLAEYSCNNVFAPEELSAGSQKRIWWKCSKEACSHEWQATVCNRTGGAGCPACSGRSATDKNNLAVTHPDLAREYMPPPKNELPANKIKAGTNKKVWWKCVIEGCGYEWEAVGSSRVRGSGCPACANRVVTEKNNLAVVRPDLASEYMAPPKNELPADKVMVGSYKKAWWKCSSEDCGHEWSAVIGSRFRGAGCPACAGLVATSKNNLLVTHPDLAREYMPPPKNELPANKIIAGTNKKVWWKCVIEGCGHEWQVTGSNRLASGKRGCPVCRKLK